MSVHGANRLGANSLLDIVVFGPACANHIKETLGPGKPHMKTSDEVGLESVDFLDKMCNADGSSLQLPSGWTCRRTCSRMLLSSGEFLSFETRSETLTVCYHSRESGSGCGETAYHYKSFEHIRVKDRSMIWNLYGPVSV